MLRTSSDFLKLQVFFQFSDPHLFFILHISLLGLLISSLLRTIFPFKPLDLLIIAVLDLLSEHPRMVMLSWTLSSRGCPVLAVPALI